MLDVAGFLLLVAGGDVVDDLAHGAAARAVEALEGGVELRGVREARHHGLPAHHGERAQQEGVGRVGHREDHAFVRLAKRQRLGLAQEAVGDLLLQEGQLGVFRGGGHRDRERLREGVGQVPRGDEPQAAEDHAELLAAPLALLQAQGALEIGGVELSPGDQDLAQAARLALEG